MKRTRPNLATAQRLVDDLSEMLEGYRIDRIWRPERQQLLIRFRPSGLGRLLVDVAPETVRVTCIEKWSDMPIRPDHTTIRFRQNIENARIITVQLEDDRRIVLMLSTKTGTHRLAIQLAGRYPNVSVWNEEEVETVRLLSKRPPIDPDSPTLQPGPRWGEGIEEETWLAAYQDHLHGVVERVHFARRCRDTIRLVRVVLKRVQRRHDALTKDMKRAQEAQKYQRYGELLKPVVGRISKGCTEIEVPDYREENTPLTCVPLDPKLNGVGNMEAYFRRYRKYHKALDGIEARVQQCRAKATQVDLLLQGLLALQARVEKDDVDSALPWTDLTGLQNEANRQNDAPTRRPPPGRRSKKKAEEPSPFRRFYAIDGSEILVGRSAKENDNLTFKVARGRDLWFHARDVSGAHVLLRTAKGQDVSNEVMLDAAILAMWHSSARKEKSAEILWSAKKHVRKPKGSPLGRVSVAGGKTLWVRHDEARISRLYASTPPGEIL